MGLPKIDIPLHKGKILSTGEEITFRPFTVKEEKILLVAQESEDVNTIFSAIEQVVGNCVQDVDVSSLPIFDITYLLLQIRAASVSEVIEFKIIDPDTNESVDLELNIPEMKLTIPEGHQKDIKIGENGYLMMRYPTFKEMQLVKEGDNEELFNIMLSCIDKLVMGDQIFKFEEFSNKEVEEFVEDLTKPTFESIKKFFDTLPTIRSEFKYTNKNNEEKTFVVEGIDSFFI